jgi:hypothetical protein
MHSPNADSSAALASHSPDLRAVMYTLHPARTSPEAIIAPMPLDPPVTTATLPRTENSEEMSPLGRGHRGAEHQGVAQRIITG